ncbi:Transposon Ty3-G Gag-Pol polyprotein [Labeo rohita]|uniref:Transposon Ty3-G Gag-Pol polyprotein n=1 Tax=Labeo rohita TaxID=84645 RepID=A0ABQ8L2M1_LABRO|nr:Transposon Ty3-G Gag-Pol polyprotein [Labeo rohita]
MAACNHSLRFLLRSLTVPKRRREEEKQAVFLLLWEKIVVCTFFLVSSEVPALSAWLYRGSSLGNQLKERISQLTRSFLTPSEGHDRCLTCLDREHAEMAFVDGSCPHCVRMSMAALRLRLSCLRRLPSAPSRPGSSGSMSSVAKLVRKKGNLTVTVRNALPGQPPWNSDSSRHPVELPKESAGSSRGKPCISFCAPEEDRISIAASEEGLMPDEAEESVEKLPAVAAAQLEANAELAAMLFRAAKSIGLVVRKPPSSEPSRLDDWFLGSRRDSNQPCPVPVPFFPEVHELLTKTCKVPYSTRTRPGSSLLTTGQPGDTWMFPRWSAYSAAGQDSSALHALAIQVKVHALAMQVHQAQALKQLHEGRPDKGVMQELRTVTDFAFRVTKVTARSLGQMADADKVRFLDMPVSQAGLFGDTVEDFAQQFSAAFVCSSPRLLHLLRLRLRLLHLRSLQLLCEGDELAVGWERSPLLRCRTQQEQPASRRSNPETGDPEMGEIALRGTSTSAPLPPGDGRGLVSLLLPTRVLSLQDQGQKVYAAACSSTFLWDATPPTLSHLPPHGCPTFGASPPPLIPLARRLEAWLSLPNPSRWLIWTVRLGYAIQFTRRPPRFRGILFISVHSDTDASVLHAEIAVLLAKDTIEPVPSAKMKLGFYSPYFIVPKKNGGLRPILDLRVLNRSLLKMPFKMLTPKCIISCIRRQDWFAAIDLKDAPFLRFAFEGRAYQYKVLPFGLGLLHMRPLQHWLCGWIPRWAWHCGTFRVSVTPECHLFFSPWSDMVFLRWHINCLELLAVFLALCRFRLILRGEHVIVRMDNMATVAYINHQGGLRSRRKSQLTRHLPPEAPLGTDALAHSWPWGLIKYAFPPVSLLAQNLCKIWEDEEQVLLAAPYWPTRT